MYDGLFSLPNHESTLYFSVGEYGEVATFESGSGSSESRNILEAAQNTFFALWFCLVFWVVGRITKSPRFPTSSLKWKWWFSPILWTSIAILWSWPAVLSGENLFVGRHHDSVGTLWFLWSGPHWVGFQDPLSAWPIGGNYQQLDSFLLLPISILFQWLHPAQLYGFLLIIGLSSSAWAAEYFAKEIGAKAPWSLIAGGGFIFHGLAATVALEGHIYQLFNPWLPLFALFWWRACQRTGSKRNALISGLFFVLSLLTSAYIGICAAIIALSFWGTFKAWKNPNSWWALSIAFPIVLGYIYTFFSHAQELNALQPKALAVGSATLENLLGTPTDIDTTSHSLGVGLLPLPIALCLIAKHYLPERSHWKKLWWLAGISLLLSLGSYLQISTTGRITILPMWFLRNIPGLSFLDFPMRLSWVFFLATSVLAARVATEIHRQKGSIAYLLIGLLILDALFLTRLPFRQQNHSPQSPTALQSIDGPILPLYTNFKAENDPNLTFTALSCLFQIEHKQPIPEDCVSVDVKKQPRYTTGESVHRLFLSGEISKAKKTLSTSGYMAISIHPDLFTESDSIRLRQALKQIDSSPTESKNAGLWTVVYSLPSQQTVATEDIPKPVPLKNLIGNGQSQSTSFTLSPTAPGPFFLTIKEGPVTHPPIRFNSLKNSAHALEQKLLTAHWDKPLSSKSTLQITNQQQNIWEGEFQPIQIEHDQIYIDINDGFRPFIPMILSPSRNPARITAVLLGWLAIVLFGWKLRRTSIPVRQQSL